MHTSSSVTLAVAVFLASAVESVEALTIIVAAGVSRGWRSALEGTAVALVVLAVLVGLLGPALIYLVPIAVLRVVIGALLLIFGLQWLRKAALRAVGLKAMHDEDAIFRDQVEALSATGEGPPTGQQAPTGQQEEVTGGQRPKRDATGFVVAFKGTFLEGLEVVIIVLGLGGASHQLGLAAVAAAAAVIVVAIIGAVVAHQLAGVPENAMKTVVGVMLVSFGTFWAGEGLGVRWPGSDLAIPVLVGVYAIVMWLLVRVLRSSLPRVQPGQAAAQVS
jgi:Ca2+/H+ antiporter, TMEM165/GDT1 family